jgi:hypothetical protein
MAAKMGRSGSTRPSSGQSSAVEGGRAGCTSGIAAARVALVASKAAVGHSSVLGAPQSASVSGWSVQPIPGKKCLQKFTIPHILRGRKFTNGMHVPLERLDAVLVHPMAQELDSGGGEQAVLLKDGEDLPEILVMLLQRVAGDDEVVQVAEHEGQVLE